MSSADRFRVLLPQQEVLSRIGEMAAHIVRDDPDEPPMLVAVVEGARTFAARLRCFLPGCPIVHEVKASSYGTGTVSSGEVSIGSGSDLRVSGCRVLLIEDIVDTGRTIEALRRRFLGAGARSCRVATLLTKPSRRVVDVPIDYVGFSIPDEFVIGFGMDHAGHYRELPDIVVYEPEAAAESAAG